MTKLILAITIAILGQMSFIGYAYAQADVVENTTALITAFGALMGSMGGIIVAVVGFAANKSKGKEISKDLQNTYSSLLKIGKSLQKTDRWISENEEDVLKLVSVISKMDPKVEGFLKDKNLEIKYLEEQLRKAKEELDTTYDTIIPNITVPK